MTKPIHRNFPYYILAISVTIFLLWGGFWFMKKDQMQTRMDDRILSANISHDGNYELKGFPNRYDFRFENFGASIQDVSIYSPNAEVLTLARRSKRAIFAFDNELDINWSQHNINIRGNRLRCSIEFTQEQMPQSYIFEGTNVTINYDEALFEFESFILGYDPERTPAWGANLISGEERVHFLAANFDDLASQIGEYYLQ